MRKIEYDKKVTHQSNFICTEFHFNTQPLKLAHFEIKLNECHVNHLPLLVNFCSEQFTICVHHQGWYIDKKFLLMVIKELPIETFFKIASFGCVFTVFYCSIWIMRFCYLIDHFAKIQNVQQTGENEIRFTIGIYE